MAKKPQAPENIEKQFNKALFKIGEPVFFTWLGTKKYGYVTAIKQTNWGIQYTVEANNTRYPCGVQIKGYRTTYTTGCIFVDETRSFDADELKRRCQSGHKSTYSEVIRESERPKDESRIDDTNKRKISRTNNNKTKSNASRTNGMENGNDVSVDGVHGDNSTKRKDSKLDSAIQRQRDFLNGFVKKD
jgi:hypothetical protein